jgi:hypothetical protein
VFAGIVRLSGRIKYGHMPAYGHYDSVHIRAILKQRLRTHPFLALSHSAENRELAMWFDLPLYCDRLQFEMPTD